MARLTRIVVPGMPHHVVQRGNRRQNVFFSDKDRDNYLELLAEACEKYAVDIWSWCLMSNHVHFIAVPEKEDSLTRCFSDAHVRYTRKINSRKGWRGHLWQGRFGSSVLDENYLLMAARYVECNPVRAGIVKVPWRYKYSSAGYNTGERRIDALVKRKSLLNGLVPDWKEFITQQDKEDDLERIRKEEAGGRPIGSAGFIMKIEKKLKRTLRRGLAGRPRVKEDE